MRDHNYTPPIAHITRVLIAGSDAGEVEWVSSLVEQAPALEVIGSVTRASRTISVAERETPAAVVVVTSQDDPSLWRIVMTLARPPLQLPVILVGPETVRTTSFLTGAEDWLPTESVSSEGLERVITNSIIRRRVAGGLPAHGHLHGLVTGMAHEVNNPLTVINADLEEAAERLEELSAATDNAELAEELDDIAGLLAEDTEAARRIGTLTRGLQNLARLADTVPAALHTGPAIRRVLERLVRQSPDTPVPVVRGAAPGPIHAAVHGFEEALYHVLLNGIQAHEAADCRDPIEVEITATPDTVVFSVRDRGMGVPPDISGRVLSPFVTGRPPGEGLGLGLTLAALALRRAGGEVEISARPGGGTEVILEFLPARARISMLIDDDEDEDEDMAAR